MRKILIGYFKLDYVKKYPPSPCTAHVLVMEMLYLWILLPLCEVPTLRKMLLSNSFRDEFPFYPLHWSY